MSVTRPKQQAPREIIDELIDLIRRQFCADLPKEEWWKMKRFMRRVVTWPAGWMTGKGMAVPPKRYREILLGVFNTIKIHGNTDNVRYWPAYLLHSVQEHFKHHGEEYLDEAKAIEAKAHLALMGLRRAPDSEVADRRIEALSSVHNALKPRRQAKKKPGQDSEQLSLL